MPQRIQHLKNCGHLIRGENYLHTYAPGDGALSFAWSSIETNLTTSQEPTRSQIRQMMNLKANEHLRKKKVRLHRINGQMRLVFPVKRIDETHLQMVDSGDVFEIEVMGDKVHYHAVNVVFFDHRGSHFEVKNISIKSRIVFFLQHENELTNTFIEQF